MRHPNIVDVLDMGIYEGVPFLVMELLEGNSLDSVLESQKQLGVDKALAWLLPIMGALAFLHDADIVHRDVKPSNIFLSSLPRHPIRPKLLDFGLARTISDLRLTRSGTVIGTPLYMAPEHASGQPTGPQSDVWSPRMWCSTKPSAGLLLSVPTQLSGRAGARRTHAHAGGAPSLPTGAAL